MFKQAPHECAGCRAKDDYIAFLVQQTRGFMDISAEIVRNKMNIPEAAPARHHGPTAELPPLGNIFDEMSDDDITRREARDA
jgi:hypothetical protein